MGSKRDELQAKVARVKIGSPEWLMMDGIDQLLAAPENAPVTDMGSCADELLRLTELTKVAKLCHSAAHEIKEEREKQLLQIMQQTGFEQFVRQGRTIYIGSENKLEYQGDVLEAADERILAWLDTNGLENKAKRTLTKAQLLSGVAEWIGNHPIEVIDEGEAVEFATDAELAHELGIDENELDERRESHRQLERLVKVERFAKLGTRAK